MLLIRPYVWLTLCLAYTEKEKSLRMRKSFCTAGGAESAGVGSGDEGGWRGVMGRLMHTCPLLYFYVVFFVRTL